MDYEIIPVLPDWHDASPAAAAVMRGAAWLDEHYPGWAALAEGADCNSATRDIICRVTRKWNYTDARVFMGIDEDKARELGFDIFDSDYCCITNQDMQPYWDAAIAERLNHTMPENTMKPENTHDHPFAIYPDGSVSYDGITYEPEAVQHLIKNVMSEIDETEFMLGSFAGHQVKLKCPKPTHLQIGCQAFHADYIRAFIEDYEKPADIPVRMGNKLIIDGAKYLVAKTNSTTLTTYLGLINVETGNIWNQPVKVSSQNTSVMLSDLTGTTSIGRFEKIITKE